MVIELNFNEVQTRLVKYTFGKEVYKDQVEQYVDYKEKIILRFPKHIENISISFVKGFVDGILANLDRSEFKEYFEIQGHKELIDKFMKSIYY